MRISAVGIGLVTLWLGADARAAGLAEQLRKDAAGPIAIVVRSGNLNAFIPSSDTEKTLVEQGVTHSAYDPLLEIVWYVQRDTLYALDLRADAVQPVEIARALGDTPFEIVVGDRVVATRRAEYADQATLPRIVWGKAKLERAKQADFVGASWMREQAKRKARAAPPVIKAKAWKGKVALPADSCTCSSNSSEKECARESRKTCGKAVDFGQTGWQLVVVGMDNTTSSDGVDWSWRYRCLLFDPGTKDFSSLADPSSWGRPGGLESYPCNGYAFEAGGKAWVQDIQVFCAAGARCHGPSVEFLGWLDPGPTI
jgi:hypothetical protein